MNLPQGEYNERNIKLGEPVMGETIVREVVDSNRSYLVQFYPLEKYSPKFAACIEMLTRMLNLSLNYGLHEEIREKNCLTYGVHAQGLMNDFAGYYSISMTTDKDSLEFSKELIKNNFKKFDNLSKKEFEQEKKKVLKDFKRFESLPLLMGQTAVSFELNNRFEHFENKKEAIRKLTVDDIKNVVNQTFGENYVFSICEQKGVDSN